MRTEATEKGRKRESEKGRKIERETGRQGDREKGRKGARANVKNGKCEKGRGEKEKKIITGESAERRTVAR